MTQIALTLPEILADHPDYAEGLTLLTCACCGAPAEETYAGREEFHALCPACREAEQNEAREVWIRLNRTEEALEMLEDLPSIEALTGAEALEAIRALVRAGDPDGDTRQGRRGASRDAETRGILEMVRCRIVHGDPLFLR